MRNVVSFMWEVPLLCFGKDLITIKIGQRGGFRGSICSSIFFEEGHKGLVDVRIMIIDKTKVNEPTEREGFWAYELNTRG